MLNAEEVSIFPEPEEGSCFFCMKKRPGMLVVSIPNETVAAALGGDRMRCCPQCHARSTDWKVAIIRDHLQNTGVLPKGVKA